MSWKPASLDRAPLGVLAARPDVCRNGHQLTAETLHIRRDGTRVCRPCDAARKRGDLVKLARQQDEIMDLSRQGMEAKEIALELNCPLGSVYQARNKLRRPGETFAHSRLGRPATGAKPDWIDDMTGERCRCGLRLPCNDCIPTSATYYAQQRREHYSDGTTRLSDP